MLNLISSKLEVKFTFPRDLLECPICSKPLLPYSLAHDSSYFPRVPLSEFILVTYLCLHFLLPTTTLARIKLHESKCLVHLVPFHFLSTVSHVICDWLTLAEWMSEHPGCLTKVFLNTARVNTSEEIVHHAAHCSVCDATPMWEIYSRMQRLGNLTSVKNLLCLFLSSY